MRCLLGVVTSLALVVAMSGPALGQEADLEPDIDCDRAAAEKTLDHSRRLAWVGLAGAGLSLAANFMSDDRKTGGSSTALAVGGVTALGLGLVGDFARYRARTRLDALDRDAPGVLDSVKRLEAERALQQGRRLGLIGNVGAAMWLVMPFFPEGHFCGSPERCGPAEQTYVLGAATAAGIGIFGWIKAARAESRLEAFDEAPQASHRVGVVPLPDGVAANYSMTW